MQCTPSSPRFLLGQHRQPSPRTVLPPNVEYISSTSNPFVKHCVKLRLCSSHRHSHKSVLLVGTVPIREIHDYQNSDDNRTSAIDCLLVLDESQIPGEVVRSAAHVIRVSSSVMEKLSGVETSESTEAVAVMRMPTTFIDVNDDKHTLDCRRWFPVSHRILVLDAIQDPGNLGTLIRSAVAFDWDGVFLLPGCCDPFNDKAIRASRGAAFRLPIVLGTWDHIKALVEEFGMRLFAGHPKSNGGRRPIRTLCDGRGDSPADIPICLVLGSEGSGLSEKSKASCELVSIPMPGEFESLNVSVAGGILMFMLQPTNIKFSA